jgi:hypothetical protein
MASDQPRAPLEVPLTPGALDRALALVRLLRAHCPWDAEQTAGSLVPHLLEETHEVVDAIHEATRRRSRASSVISCSTSRSRSSSPRSRARSPRSP